MQITTSHRTYYLLATDEKERNEWIEAIKSQLNRSKSDSIENRLTPSNTESFKSSLSSSDSKIENSLKLLDLGPDTKEKMTLEDFEIITVIGKGSFGKVAKVRGKNNKIYALKMLDKRTIIEREEIEHTKTEKKILQFVKNPFLMCLHYSFQTYDKLYMVMDFVNGGEIFFHLQQEHTFDNNRTKFYACEIILALEYLHQNGIIYRDLKPENVLLDSQGHVKITDFGLSKQGLSQNGRTNSNCGTPEYIAPEVLQGLEYGKEVDWWSLGSLIYEMLTGLPPFYDEDIQKMYLMKLTENVEFPQDINSNAVDFVSKLLDKNPCTRLKDPYIIKKHAWFSDIVWEDIANKRVSPPFKPPVPDDDSIACIDEEFLDMTFSDLKSNPNNQVQPHFDDFSYKSIL